MSTKKNILMFIDSIGYGGAQNQFVRLAVMLKEYGFKVKILVVYDEFDFYKDAINDIEIICDPKAKNPFIRLFRLPRLIINQSPDIVIAYLDSQCILACIARFFSHFKLIVSERNTTQHVGIKEKIKFYLYRFADFIVPNSNTQGRFLTSLRPEYKGKIHVITNVIDLSRFAPPTRRERHVIPQIISVGRDTAQKNYLGMIEVIKLLHERGVKAHFNWYAGECEVEYKKRVTEKIKEYGLGNMISIFEPTKNIEEKYCESDFFWLYSFYEGFPNVLCEAMCTGLPVACSNVCDNGDIVIDGVNGVLADPYDYEGMAEQLNNLLSLDDAELKRLSINNVQRIKDLCSEKGFLEKYLVLINN